MNTESHRRPRAVPTWVWGTAALALLLLGALIASVLLFVFYAAPSGPI
ncbi:MAG: hypothetical protein ABI054_03025 [Planctomycetota bacterium]